MLVREGSAFPCWWRIMPYRICLSPCLTWGLLLSFTSITTEASTLWLMLVLSSNPPPMDYSQKNNLWLFIMLYLLYVLLWVMLVTHLWLCLAIARLCFVSLVTHSDCLLYRRITQVTGSKVFFSPICTCLVMQNKQKTTQPVVLPG